ncbi:uncharacterized protein UHOD_11651 [Ustilago sp. UG-2017b]|nr:uncharacterized protein UHOD_11651 [Ustilago sp. UG-2017b]
MTTSTDDSLDISAQLFWQSTTPTSSATQTESVPALSQSGSTSAPDIHTSCPTRASRSATGKKNCTWSGADVLHLITILYNSESYQRALLPVIGLSTQGRSTGTKARKKTTIAGLGMVEQEARGLAGTGSRNGWSATSMESAVSMETMDTED